MMSDISSDPCPVCGKPRHDFDGTHAWGPGELHPTQRDISSDPVDTDGGRLDNRQRADGHRQADFGRGNPESSRPARDISSDPVDGLVDGGKHADWCATVRNPRQADAPVLCNCGVDGVKAALYDRQRDISSVTGSTIEYLLEDEDGAPFPDEFQTVAWQRIHDREREAVEPWRKAVERLLESGGADTFTPEADTAWRGLRVLLEGQDR